MKAIAYCAIIALTTAGIAEAQTIGCARPGVVVMKGREDMRRGFARMQIESIFNGVTLTEDQRQKAEEIISSARDRSPGVAQASDEKHAGVMRERNDKLRALLSSEAEKGKVSENLNTMAAAPNRCDVTRP